MLITGRFEIEWLAGAGGMADIYRARDRLTGEPVALKMIRDGGPESASRFVREALLLAELRHPGIARYVAHGETETGVPYLAMEWLEGEDVAKRLRRRAFSASEAIQVVRQVAEALAFAHAAGVVHRDVKPSNILLDGGRVDRVRLLDFGIARHEMSTLRLTKTGTMIGTLAYMSPEQCRGDRAVDARTDVFSLGCVLYECLTGRAPFKASHPLTTMTKLFLEEPPRLRDTRPHTPPVLDALVHRMLSKSPANRPRNAAAVATALAALPPAALGGDDERLESVAAACGAAGPPCARSAGADTTERRR